MSTVSRNATAKYASPIRCSTPGSLRFVMLFFLFPLELSITPNATSVMDLWSTLKNRRFRESDLRKCERREMAMLAPMIQRNLVYNDIFRLVSKLYMCQLTYGSM
jgi:hypothetical protein